MTVNSHFTFTGYILFLKVNKVKKKSLCNETTGVNNNINVDKQSMSAAIINIINYTVLLLFIKMSALEKKKKVFSVDL